MRTLYNRQYRRVVKFLQQFVEVLYSIPPDLNFTYCCQIAGPEQMDGIALRDRPAADEPQPFYSSSSLKSRYIAYYTVRRVEMITIHCDSRPRSLVDLYR